MKILLFFILLSTQIFADQEEPSRDILLPPQTIQTVDGTVKYSASRGLVPVLDGDKKEQSQIHYIAYFLEPQNSTRPILFCFNGGPGSSSVWLHMGLLGPFIVQAEHETKAPYQLIQNRQTALRYADLIFIDPVSTGFSVSKNLESDKKFLGVKEDISSCTQCIQTLLSRFNRWNSPLYLVGESYGGLRAVGIAAALKEKSMINVDGIFMISPAIDLQSIVENSILSQICAFPTYALIAQYFKKSSAENLKKSKDLLYQEARLFAQTALFPLLIQGDSSNEKQTVEAAKKMEDYTGISAKDLKDTFLHLPVTQFQEKLLKEKSLMLGTFDGRTTITVPLTSSTCTFDPSLDSIATPFVETAMQYLRDKLGWDGKGSYTILAREHGWDWKGNGVETGFGYLSYTDQLRCLMLRCPNLKLFVASGFYDLATPMYSQEYTVDQLLLKNKERITIKKFESGHMIYLSPQNRDTLLESMQQFICGK